MTYYGDLECPICRDFTLSGGFPQLVANDIRAGKVKVVYKAFETATPSPQTFQTQQVAALAAGKQNHFWDYAELFYREQGAEGRSWSAAHRQKGTTASPESRTGSHDLLPSTRTPRPTPLTTDCIPCTKNSTRKCSIILRNWPEWIFPRSG